MRRLQIKNLVKKTFLGFIIAIFFSSASFAQKESSSSSKETSKWLNSTILVEKRARRTSTWIRISLRRSVFVSKKGRQSLRMAISASGNKVTIEMTDPNSKFTGGTYTGEIKNGHFIGVYQEKFVRRAQERAEIYSIRPGADLRKADLSGADLTGANLTGANLAGANITGAVVSRTSTRGVNFRDWTRRGGIVKK